jgi:hypothetical protein
VAVRALVLSEKLLRKGIDIHECGKEDQILVDKAKLNLIRQLRKKTVLGLKLVDKAMEGSHPKSAVNVKRRWSEMLAFIESSSVWGLDS